MRGKVVSGQLLREPMFVTDLVQHVDALDVPVYFVHGGHDLTCSDTGAKALFDGLAAL